MRRYSSLLVAIPALALVLALLTGCPGPGKTTTTGGGTSPTTTAADGGKKVETVSAKAYDGVVKGKVTYDGTPPKMGPISAMDEHAEKATCHKGPDVDQTWLVDGNKDGGGVANVIVYLEPTGGKAFAVEKKLADGYKDAWIDQPHCVYEPQTVALFARFYDKEGKANDTGLKFVAKNSSSLSHNTKVSGNGKKGGNPEAQDKNIKADGGSESFELVYQKELLGIGCTKHTWMTASLKTFDHPFFAVTGKDGTYEIKNAPVDLEVVVKTWHKDAADVTTDKQTFKSGNNEVNLKVKKG